MKDINPIRSDADYHAALRQVEQLFGADPNTPDGKRLDILLALIENWERQKKFDVLPPNPIAAIKFRMEQRQLSQKDLVPYIGSLSKVSEVLSGKRDLSLSMIRALNKGLDIPAEVLISKTFPEIPEEIPDLSQQIHRFPLKEMKKKDWFKDIDFDIKDCGEEVLRIWLAKLEGYKLPLAIFPRAARQTAKADKYALFAWCVKVLIEARKINAPNYTAGCLDESFLQDLKKFSLLTDGPKRACDVLRQKGIRLVIEDHLSKTYLDGALLSLNGEPVIGLTLRYDRVDYFWFTLFHELGHLSKDFKKNDPNILFVDDITLDSNISNDESEKNADAFARNMLIPDNEWKAEMSDKPVPSSAKVIELAFKWQVNPAIIAGRLRYELKNYRLFPDFVGTGEIKPLFKSA